MSGVATAPGTAPSTGPDTAIVVGAGVVGVATAWALARRGIGVTLIDAEAEAGRGTSFANGAQLSYVYTDALAAPALLKRLPALALALDPAFRLTLSPDPHLAAWLLRFVRNCTAARFRANTLAGLELGLESRAAMTALLERHPIDFAHAMPGKLHLHAADAGFAAARGVMALKAVHGAEQAALSPAEAVALEPALAERPGPLTGAIWSPQEAVGDPYRFANGLCAVLRESYGMTARFGVRVAAIGPGAVMTDAGERIAADRIVLCAGIGINRLAAPLGQRLPVMPMKGYSFTAASGPAAPAISITDVARKLVFARLDGRMRIAGLADLGQGSVAVDQARLRSLLSTAREALPMAADYGEPGAGWAGLRPLTPDSLPIVRGLAPGIVVNAGHGGLGWTFAMATGDRAAALALAQS